MTNKEQQIYDILYNLSVDETDCRECQNYYACENACKVAGVTAIADG